MAAAHRMLGTVLVAELLGAGPASAAEPARRYAVIVAHNASLDEGVTPLTYAVDDGAKYQELLQAAGVQTTLLAAFDAEASRRHPEAAASARPPTRAAVLEAVTQAFATIRADSEAGRETHFYFVYSGHGSLGPNREGYINLADARLTRGALYREVIARSPASFNHLVLDACYAYFLVLKRGGPEKEGDYRAAVRDFLQAEELASYPNTGVILASSSSSESHEWGQWEAGIFSHELRSGLLGPADVNQDGSVSYDEAAAFVEAANAAIDVPKARLRVFYRPPASRRDTPLLDLSALRGSPTLEIAPDQAGQYHLEDGRGVRVADLHPTAEQPVRVALVGKEPFWLRTSQREAVLPKAAHVSAAELTFEPLQAAPRGSIEQSFRRSLFQVPFGLGFYRGAVAERGRLEEQLEPTVRLEASRSLRPKVAWGLGALGGAVALGAASGLAYGLAADSHGAYQAATTADEARRQRKTTEDRVLASRVLAGVAGAAAVAGAVVLLLDWSEARPPVTLQLAPGGSGATATLSGRW